MKNEMEKNKIKNEKIRWDRNEMRIRERREKFYNDNRLEREKYEINKRNIYIVKKIQEDRKIIEKKKKDWMDKKFKNFQKLKEEHKDLHGLLEQSQKEEDEYWQKRLEEIEKEEQEELNEFEENKEQNIEKIKINISKNEEKN